MTNLKNSPVPDCDLYESVRILSRTIKKSIPGTEEIFIQVEVADAVYDVLREEYQEELDPEGPDDEECIAIIIAKGRSAMIIKRYKKEDDEID